MTDPNSNTSQSRRLECLARQLEAAEQERANALSLLERARAELARTQSERDRAVSALIGLRKETFFNLARDAERRDGESPMHTVRIGAYASLIATSLGCTPAWSEMLETAAQMHDIGKIGIHDSILSKTGPLTTEEWRIMREHPRIGAAIIGQSEEPLLQLAGEIALTHHEHYNGAGYPRGLCGNDIPLAGRIVGVADFFDALTHDRSYRKALPVDTVLSMIRERRGEQFDPQVVDAFLRISGQIKAARQRIVEQERFSQATAGWDGDWWMLA
ncbi:HD domain-containing phosphohydrolase [Zoogloea sp.]|uniref:HD-GYP domain-containing protein n=1 Tax=Zoogloea sp. TaxID=49181 RepID=UPI0025F21A0B|nr:HD domain-containing phosphohydrolase [Zoogloea sp.]